MKAVGVDTMSCMGLVTDSTKCRRALKQHFETGDDERITATADKRACRKDGSSSIRSESRHRCDVCNKNGHSTPALSDAVRAQQDINKIIFKNIRMFTHGHL